MSSNSHPVEQHYTSADLLRRIDEGLVRAGKDPLQVTVDDLAAIDQFHLGGKAATQQLAQLAEINPGAEVLDIGGGIGGAARLLAHTTHSKITVLDLTQEFVSAGKALTERLGFNGSVNFVYGDALAMPFADAQFGVAWTQHATMNIHDKRKLYGEVHRILKPGGKFAMHDVLAGTSSEIRFPVPWASRPEISFVAAENDIRATLAGLGFRALHWNDETKATTAWLTRRVESMQRAAANPGSPQAFGLGVILGPATPLMFANLLHGLQSGALRVVQAVFQR